MPTSGNVPVHLLVAARTGFLNALKMPDMPWQRIASTINMDARSIDLVDLGNAPMPMQDKGGQVAQDFVERTLTIKPIDWMIKTWISYNAVQDDRTGTLENRVRGAATNFQKHINNLVFATLDAGDGATYGACYDGQYFFDSDHKDKGAHYQTNQSNVNALALSLDNFDTVRIAAQKYVDDQGEYTSYYPNLIVVPPDLERTAANICNNPEAMDTANREINPFSGQIKYIVSPKLASTAWVLACENEATKPLIVAMREQPSLQDSWFDPDATDGGRYYFKFFGRYNVFYGDWRLATMGNT